jgi:hypothetical protein
MLSSAMVSAAASSRSADFTALVRGVACGRRGASDGAPISPTPGATRLGRGHFTQVQLESRYAFTTQAKIKRNSCKVVKSPLWV